ncbi:hypothetical protein JOQ06_028521, partial [Pogonophryne albipinna]
YVPASELHLTDVAPHWSMIADGSPQGGWSVSPMTAAVHDCDSSYVPPRQRCSHYTPACLAQSPQTAMENRLGCNTPRILLLANGKAVSLLAFPLGAPRYPGLPQEGCDLLKPGGSFHVSSRVSGRLFKELLDESPGHRDPRYTRCQTKHEAYVGVIQGQPEKNA